jgi:hypothetical protein
MVTCFHETRHAFQPNVVNNLYKGTEIVDTETTSGSVRLEAIIVERAFLH